ncbi:MAG: nodulation protein NfeD [Bacteroidetes bacterium]|jgi:membrane-bound serine protease (ClpP class)|nr:nodulation protein NfeD [Bacteroidota bacterium]
MKYLFVLFSFLLTMHGFAKEPLVYRFNFQSEVDRGTARMFSKAMFQAQEMKADLFLIHLNTYGGMLDAADSIRNTIINSDIPVVVFIDRNAASAGALISIACNRIYMRSGSSIGAATVVTQDGQAAPDKYQSYMRAMMRATAEKRNRDPKIAEAMVDPRVVIPGVNDSGRVLTFTASEALANNYCNAIVESEKELLQKENFTAYTTTEYHPSWADNAIGFLIHPAVSSILILIMLAGLYFEFQAPGTIFPIAASVLAAVLYFAPLYLEGLAANWEILLFATGVILLAVEFFVIPGFGITGIAGIICTTLGFALSMLNNNGWDFTFTSKSQIIMSVTVTSGAMLFSIVLVIFLLSRINDSKRLSKLALNNTLESVKGYHAPADSDDVQIGMNGIAHTDLRPSGKIMMNGRVYDAVAESGWIHKGEQIEVVATGMTLTVRTLSV